MSNLEFFQFPCLKDNYGVLVHDREAGLTASIDSPEEDAVRRAIDKTGWGLTHLFMTHHHFDHVDGIAALKQDFNAHIVGPKAEADKINALDETVEGGDVVRFGQADVLVIASPGHTLGQVNYYFSEAGAVFTGDTLFALGCGRIFEGDAEMMWGSLCRLMALPDETRVYCGHEYTLANARFAVTIDPHNAALIARVLEVERLRADGRPTLPTSIGLERRTNPFVRPHDSGIREHLNMQRAADAEVFAEIRARKDRA